jgi:sugar O-acyltransferase (sialic acid O-acetyltransferase NeuD family)
VRVVIAGAGGHGKVVCDALLASGLAPCDLIGFVDDDPTRVGEMVMGFPVIANLESLALAGSVRVVVAIGDNSARSGQCRRAIALGYELFSVVHPTAVIGRGCVLGDGVVVMANVVINADTRVGNDVILNTACIVEHDCVVGDHVHVAPGAKIGGGVSVGDRTLVGIGSTVIPGVTIGTDCIVGAGGVLIDHLESGSVAVGVPARVAKGRKNVEP